MSLPVTAQLVIALAIDTIVAVAVCAAAYAVLSTFLWAWLAFILAAIASAYASVESHVVQGKAVAYDHVTTYAAKALDWFAAKRAAA